MTPIRSSEITPEHVYLNRRQVIRRLGAGAGALALAGCGPGAAPDEGADAAAPAVESASDPGSPVVDAPSAGAATDELGNTDSSTVAVEIPYEILVLDTEAPTATISAIALGNGGAKTYAGDFSKAGLIVAGDNSFIKIWAESQDTDLRDIFFEYSLDGGASWSTLDVNDYNDFYVDLDDTVGFTLDDAILIDVYDDDTTFTVTDM